jgi:hypothetical protein
MLSFLLPLSSGHISLSKPTLMEWIIDQGVVIPSVYVPAFVLHLEYPSPLNLSTFLSAIELGLLLLCSET